MQPRDPIPYVADEVRAHLARHRVTQRDVASLLGKAQPTISRKLDGRTPFTLRELALIADRLGVEVSEFFATSHTRGAAITYPMDEKGV